MGAEPWVQDHMSHKDDLSIITVGSGVPGPFSHRAESMTVIQYKGRYIVLDCGYTTVYKLIKDKYQLSNIDIIMFTHLHADHSSDFLNLMTWRYLNGGRKLDIIGPPRTRQYYEFYKDFYRDDILYRALVYDINTSAGSLEDVNVHELHGSQELMINNINIKSSEMVHTMYDLAYKFIFGEKTIVVTGDTSYTSNLVQLAKGVDLLVLDGSFILFALAPPVAVDEQNPIVKIHERKVDDEIPIPVKNAGDFSVESHLNYNDIIKIVGEIKPKGLILTHLFSSFMGNKDPHPKKLLDKVRNDLKDSGFTGNVYFAEDGMEVGV